MPEDASEEVSSFEQDHWTEICCAVRFRLAKAAERNDLCPAELYNLSRAIETAQWNETRALTWDALIEERKKALERETLYGG